LHDVLELCPHATVVINAFGAERLNLERPLPMERLRWIEPGGTFDAVDRRMRLILPPIFDGPTTRGVLIERTGVLGVVDSFAALTTGAVHRRDEVPDDLSDETFPLFSSLISPWHQSLDPVEYGNHIDSVAALRTGAIASAHGPILTGDQIDDAQQRIRALAGQPRLVLHQGADLDEFVTAAITSADEELPAV
jgi:flavorubredoxin